MNKLRVLFFFGLLGVVIAIARCNSRPNSRAESPIFPATSPVLAAAPSFAPAIASTPAPVVAAAPSASPTVDFHKVSGRVAPAVVLISLFDQSGKFLSTASGSFISEDGKLVTSANAARTAANAVAKTSDGHIYNVAGILADAGPIDLAVLKAETKSAVPHVSPAKIALPDAGAKIAVVGSPLSRRKPAEFETSVSARRQDPGGDWLEVTPPIPNDLLGSPVINDKGELLGLVTSPVTPGAANIVRASNAVETAVARIDPHATVGWLAAQTEPPPPAEGPKQPPRFAKIPLVQADRPGNSKLVFSPKPAYPLAGRHSMVQPKGSGRFRVSFAANGQVKNVEVLESTRSQTLDSAATDTLRKWKAAPGQEWSATVPITFQP